MQSIKYNPEEYWNEVALQIDNRQDLKIIAGDDEPYYRYKRQKFLKLLDGMNTTDLSVLEIGSGPGGNLDYLRKKTPPPRLIAGADIAQSMVNVSKQLLNDSRIEVRKSDGTHVPYGNNEFNIVFTATVLQHNVDEEKLEQLIADICRVSSKEVFIFERIEKQLKGHESNTGRPVQYYAALFSKNGFTLIDTRFINIDVSYFVCGAIRKLFNPRSRKEGEAVTSITRLLQSLMLPITSLFDKLVRLNRDVAMLRFKKNN